MYQIGNFLSGFTFAALITVVPSLGLAEPLWQGTSYSELTDAGGNVVFRNIVDVEGPGSASSMLQQNWSNSGQLQPGSYTFQAFSYAASDSQDVGPVGANSSATGALDISGLVSTDYSASVVSGVSNDAGLVGGSPVSLSKQSTSLDAALQNSIDIASNYETANNAGNLNLTSPSGTALTLNWSSGASSDSSNAPAGENYDNFNDVSESTTLNITITKTANYLFVGSASAAVLGSSQIFPILPTPMNSTSKLTFPTNPVDGISTFNDTPSDLWIDPPSADTFTYQMTNGSLFTNIDDFPTGFDHPFTVTADGIDLGSFGPGNSVNFISLLGGGVSAFSVSGISPLADPGSPTAFPLQIGFNTSTANFTVSATPVPEPVSASLLGLASLGLLVRRHA
jgi:hypothetical protein